MTQLLAVDWGTSSLRGALLDASGKVLAEHTCARGILTVPAGSFAPVFEANFAHLMGTPGTFVLISGMAGSRQGWLEAPYCPCPAGFDVVAGRLAWIEPGRVAIVPGLQCAHDGVPDVMRGEETQVFGAMQLLGLRDGLFVLPGTHSKWVTVRDGCIADFRTAMTGEVYALLRGHSILSRTMAPTSDSAQDDAFDGAAFDAGVACALRGSGLLQTAFSARTLALFERLPAAAGPSYLSGLVIGEELRAQPMAAGAHVVLIGAEALAARYQRALAQRGITSQSLGADATWRGLWAIAQSGLKLFDA